jgi:hypothetical protein
VTEEGYLLLDGIDTTPATLLQADTVLNSDTALIAGGLPA